MDYRLQVLRLEKGVRDSVMTYRFAVVDYRKSKSYPANFVCMLPAKVDFVKGKTTNVFGGLFREKSTEFAVELLKKALINEKDDEVKTEIERRLKLFNPKQGRSVECSECKKTFQPAKYRKYKQHFCRECYRKKFGPNLS